MNGWALRGELIEETKVNTSWAAMAQLNSLARAHHRILELAGTIADLARCKEIQSVHLAEALQYRPKSMLS